ncbi:energy-coupling factor transporter transmembrane component T [Candidatus Villigracilis affinis]|uniref:energy-coupling factor transporter transmembrane component T family protein n=1 Tax=Candidatus Villigracilis affinis TaxID=3140682 RepID=UPI001E14849A|nr:energy-coupling factor transporter transmembrane protein EcfT [Anaerolineales bacterium]MBL0346178.1 energy-coupling factor transporter transmembrane protein EcfT [Anaerolineales bacterium]
MSEHSLRYIDNDSFFTRIDALSKLIWVILVILTTFQLTSNLSRVVMLAVVVFVMIILARVPLKTIWQAMPIILIMGTLLFFVHLFTAPSTQTINVLGFSVGKEGFDKGLQYFLRITIMVLASFILIWTTDIRDLMVGLVSIGMPYRYAFTVFMALRFLPVVQQEVDAVKAAHAIRGRASSSPIRHRIRLWQRYMFTVIVNGLRKAENTALAIESRGFGAFPDRTFVKEFHWTKTGIILLILFIVFAIWLIFWEKNLPIL